MNQLFFSSLAIYTHYLSCCIKEVVSPRVSHIPQAHVNKKSAHFLLFSKPFVVDFCMCKNVFVHGYRIIVDGSFVLIKYEEMEIWRS